MIKNKQNCSSENEAIPKTDMQFEKIAFIVGKPLKTKLCMIHIILNAMIDMHTCICNWINCQNCQDLTSK